jgi:hypothetical protein
MVIIIATNTTSISKIEIRIPFSFEKAQPSSKAQLPVSMDLVVA